MKIERFSSWDALGLAPEAWNALVDRTRAPVPFLGWDFQTAWTRRLGPGPLHLLGARDGAGEWVAALPLYEAPEPDGMALRLVGGTDVADYLDLVAVAGREEEAWTALLPALLELPWRSLDLRPIPAGSPTREILPTLATAAGLECRVAVEDRCPVISLPASWEEYLATCLGGKDRHELRRKLRRAEAARPEVEVLREVAGLTRGLDEFIALHKKSKVGKARFMDEPMEGFFREVGAGLIGRGQAALWTLRFEGRPAAALFCLELPDGVGLYNSGFDPEARALSPGVVLIARTIEDAIQRGRRRYDLLRGEEPYKYGFGAAPTEVLRITLERNPP